MGTPFPPGQQPNQPQQPYQPQQPGQAPYQGGQPNPGQPGQAPYPGAFTPEPQPQPKKRGLLKVGVVMLLAGLLVAALFGVLAFLRFPKPGDFPRASGIGQSVELSAGEWTVFEEGVGGFGPLDIQAPNGETVELGPIFSSQNYTIGGNSGTAIGKIQAPVDGQYLVSTGEGGTVAFAQGFASSLAWAIGLILGAVFLGGGLFVVGAILALIGALKR